MTSKEDLHELVRRYEQATPVNEGGSFADLVNAAIQVNVRFGTWEIGNQEDMDNFARACKLYSQGLDYSDAMRSAIYDKHE